MPLTYSIAIASHNHIRNQILKFVQKFINFIMAGLHNLQIHISISYYYFIQS